MGFSTILRAASLTALLWFFAIGAFAEDSDAIYKAGFVPQTPFGGNVLLRLQDNSISPLLVVVEDSNGRDFPLSFELDHKNILLGPHPLGFDAVSLRMYFQADSRSDRVTRTKIYANGDQIDGEWGLPVQLTTGLLTDVTDSLSFYTVGVPDTHTVAFTTTTTPLTDSGIVWIVFPTGFDISSVDSAIYSDNDPLNDLLEPTIRAIAADGNSLLLYLSYGGLQAQIGSRIQLKFWSVLNDTTAGSNSLLVITTRYNGEIVNGPVESSAFPLFAGPLDRLIMLPDTATTMEAGSFLDFAVTGLDVYGNVVSGLSFIYDVTVDSCGQLIDGNFHASKIGTTFVTATTNGLTDSTGLITVVPGPLDRFFILGYPSARIAGQPFPQDIIVAALDGENNPKYDYFGQLWFTTGDTIDDLPNEAGNPYTFTIADSGIAIFPGSSFILKRAGVRTITVTNGSVGASSNPIRVNAAIINSFLLNAISPQTAGLSFYVTVDSAIDLYGNPSAGEVTLADSIGGGPSPDGIPPSYSQIVIANGTGRALQTLTHAVPTMLSGTLANSDARANTGLFQVLPGILGRFVIARYPDIIIAGEEFPQGVSVSAYDLFGNLKTNYEGYIYFTSSDSSALLPYTWAFQFNFLSQYQGTHIFNEPFSLRTAGRQLIAVTDGVLETISNIISVSPGAITSITLNAPETVYAAQPFVVSAAGAVDAWGNAANGIIIVSDSIGGGSSPDNIPASFNNIAVDSGSGQALQTLVYTVPTMLKGEISGESLVVATDLIEVRPGLVGRFGISGFPTNAVAGDTFSQVIDVAVFDQVGNLKTDFNDSVYFVSTDPQAVLPYVQSAPFHFQSQYGGLYTFNEPFALRTAGGQSISITDGAIQNGSGIIIVDPATMSIFDLVAPDTVVAGQPFSLLAGNAQDIWGNAANGTIIVDDSVGGGPSPDGITPIFNQISVNNGSGQAYQTLTNAELTVLSGILSGDTISAITNLIIVNPGPLGRYEMSGYPGSTVAGDTLPAGISVEVYDSFGNPKSDYDDFVFFESTDSQAMLPYSDTSPFHFLSQFGGVHTFNEPFSLRTAGNHTISFTNGIREIVSPNIFIEPNIINSFALFAPGLVAAGQSFILSASEARDVWDNLANGTILVSDSIGGGPAPDGTLPVFSSITVFAGIGSASQTLFHAVPTILKGTSGSVVNITQEIDVLPGPLGSLVFELSSPQIAAVPFSGTAMITAYDPYDNPKTNFDAFVDTVVISSSAGGDMANNILNQVSDFAQGVADLVAEGTTYYGRGGSMTFLAASQSGVIGYSSAIEISAMICESLIIDQQELSHGDTATGSIVVTNLASADLDVTSLSLIDNFGWNNHPQTNPSLPVLVGPGQSRTFDFQFEIEPSMSFGVHAVTAAAGGLYSSYAVFDTIAGFPDTFAVTAASIPGYVGNSLAPETLSTNSIYSISLRLSNTGTSGLALYDSSYFSFSDGVHQFRAGLLSSLYLPPNSPAGVMAGFDSTIVDPAFIPGTYQGDFRYFGNENGLFRTGDIPVTDAITIQGRASLAYMAGSLDTDSLATGQSAAISIQIQNSGDADFIVDHTSSRLAFSDSENQYIAYSDTTSGIRVDIIPPGPITFRFSRSPVSLDLAPGQYQPDVIISGYQNGHPEIVPFATSGDSIKVLSRAAVSLDTTFSMSLNQGIVNIDQPCSIVVGISNRGQEAAESLFIHLDNSGSSNFPDSIYLQRLAGLEMREFVFNGNAATLPDPNDVFTSSIVGGRGAVSGNPATILPPIDNIALLVVETPARVSLSPLIVTEPAEAMDDTISTSQTITLSTTVSNLGQAGFSGTRQLLLDIGSSGWDIDSVGRDFVLNGPVYWRIEAPANPVDSAVLMAQFRFYLTDINDGTSAFGADTLTSRRFVVDSTPFVNQSPAITSPSGAVDEEISTNQNFVITDTLFASGLYSYKAVKIILPSGFTTNDSLVKYPEGYLASWNLRAPSSAGDFSITLASWIYDRNTGESLSTTYQFVPVDVIEAASLMISSRIISPPAAMDGIIQPGGQIQFEATVRNLGLAQVGPGQVRLHTGHPDMVPVENPIRDLTVDDPIIWTIIMPDTEIPYPVPISTNIITLPIEDNTGLPAFILLDSTSISVVIRELYPKLVLTNVSGHRGSVFEGQQLRYLTFSLFNNDFGGNFPIAISGFTFDIFSNPDLIASDLILAASITSDSGQSGDVGFDQRRITIALSDSVYLEPSAIIDFEFGLSINPATNVRDFSIYLDADFVSADVIENGFATQQVAAISQSGEPVSWQGDPTAILERSFAASISSYPNPFSPREGGTRIGYYLPAPSNLEVRIFTLLGELVWSKDVSSSEPLGTAGLHTDDTALPWNGKNDIGHEIRSGVYICIIRNRTTGEEEKFKIAVVK